MSTLHHQLKQTLAVLECHSIGNIEHQTLLNDERGRRDAKLLSQISPITTSPFCAFKRRALAVLSPQAAV